MTYEGFNLLGSFLLLLFCLCCLVLGIYRCDNNKKDDIGPIFCVIGFLGSIISLLVFANCWVAYAELFSHH